MKDFICMEVTNISFPVAPCCHLYRVSSVSFVLRTYGGIRPYPLSLVYSHFSFQSHFKGGFQLWSGPHFSTSENTGPEESTLPENSLDMHILKPHSDPTYTKTLWSRR